MSSSIGLLDLDEMIEDLNLEDDPVDDYFYDILYNLTVAIVEKRNKMKMNQTEFAKYLGVTQPMVSKYENGDYNFTVRQICKIAVKLDLDPYEFILGRSLNDMRENKIPTEAGAAEENT